jgi:putative hemolysin
MLVWIETGLVLLLLAACLAVSSVASYLRLLLRRLSGVAGRKLFHSRPNERIQFDRERVGVSLSAVHGVAMALFSLGLAALFLRHPVHPGWENLLPPLLIILAVISICDQLIPFLLVARHDEPDIILRDWLPALRGVVYAALPITFPILVSTTIRSLLEPEDAKEEVANAQENLQELIEAGEEEGLIERSEGEILQSVVEFGEKQARDVMTPRPEIAAIEINASVENLRNLFRERRYTRYPVYAGQLDRIEGIVSVRDLMEMPPEEQSRATLRGLVRPVLFVPETKLSSELLKELQKSTNPLAMVIDEYGNVAGLVTLEDLVEEIVGDIRDEVEPHDKDIVRESAGTYVVAGQTGLGQLSETVERNLEDGDYSTVAGFLLAHLGHVPVRGEKFEENGLSFEVLDATPRTVLKVRIRLQPSTAATRPDIAEHTSF